MQRNRGDLRVEDGDGDIAVATIAPMGELRIRNRNGAIELTVPLGGFSAAGHGQERQYRLQVEPAGQQRRRRAEHLRPGGRRRAQDRAGGRSRRHHALAAWKPPAATRNPRAACTPGTARGAGSKIAAPPSFLEGSGSGTP